MNKQSKRNQYGIPEGIHPGRVSLYGALHNIALFAGPALLDYLERVATAEISTCPACEAMRFYHKEGCKLEPLLVRAREALAPHVGKIEESVTSALQNGVPLEQQRIASEAMHYPYFLRPQPEIFDIIIANLRDPKNETNLGANCAVEFMMDAHPELVASWRKKYNTEMRAAVRVVTDHWKEHDTTGAHFVGWNDYYMAAWLIRGDKAAMDELRRRYDLPGEVGDWARWMIESMKTQCPAFKTAFLGEDNRPS